MTNIVHQQPYSPTILEALYTGTRNIAADTGNTVLTAARSTKAFLHVVFDLNAELLRIADEWDDTLPEHAARLRAVVRKGWDW